MRGPSSFPLPPALTTAAAAAAGGAIGADPLPLVEASDVPASLMAAAAAAAASRCSLSCGWLAIMAAFRLVTCSSVNHKVLQYVHSLCMYAYSPFALAPGRAGEGVSSHHLA